MSSLVPEASANDQAAWLDTERWRDFRQDNLDELSRARAGLPAYSLHPDMTYVEAEDLPLQEAWLWPLLKRATRWLRGWLTGWLAERLACVALRVQGVRHH